MTDKRETPPPTVKSDGYEKISIGEALIRSQEAKTKLPSAKSEDKPPEDKPEEENLENPDASN